MRTGNWGVPSTVEWPKDVLAPSGRNDIDYVSNICDVLLVLPCFPCLMKLSGY